MNEDIRFKCPSCGSTDLATGTTSYGANMILCNECGFAQVLGEVFDESSITE